MCKLGLVTVLFNSDAVLEGFFKSISQQSFKDYHLYLIDNTPLDITDGLISKYTSKYFITQFTHIKNNSNVGVAKGNNQGIELSIAAGTTYTLLLNNDIEFDQPNLFQKMYDKALTDNETLIIPKILYFDTRRIWMAGGDMRPYKGIIRHVGDNGDIDDPAFNQPKHFSYAPTCFMLIDNNLFKEIGIMNEKYFVYYDDTDFIYRATVAGYKVNYMPDLIVQHKVSSSTGGQESPFTVYYSNRNRLYFIRKNLTGIKYLSALTFTLTTRVIKLINSNKAERKNLYKAVIDGLRMS